MSAISIVIVGAGPAGCYAAQALRKEFAGAEITVLDRLPVPFGLLRYGVAADHQGTKQVQRQFDRLFQGADVEFLGGLELGRDVHLDQLTTIFDVVVLSTGVPNDRRLGIVGEKLDGVIGAGRLTRALNSHPEVNESVPVVSPRVAIVGSGNVAVDLLRLLSKGAQEWNGSDMDDEVLGSVIPKPVTDIHLISRSGAEKARWDASMLREIGGLHRPGIRLATGSVASGQSPAAHTLRELLMGRQRPTDLTINLHLACSVEQILGAESVTGIRICGPAGERKEVAVNTVLTAIGFESQPSKPFPPGVYTTGWLRTGPQGTIPLQRTLSKQLASDIATDYRLGVITSNRPGRRALPITDAVDFDAWSRIDAFECGRAQEGRVRRKIMNIEQMYSVARRTADTLSLGKEAIN